MKGKIAIALLITAAVLSFSQSLYSQEQPLSKKEAIRENIQMKVSFYAIDREKVNKGEYLGFAELKEGKLTVEVKDSKLEKILKNPYTTMTGEKKNNVFIDKLITYQSGTLEHLRAIAIECYRFGYIGEIAK